MEQVSVAVRVGIPDPHVAGTVIRFLILPVEGQLARPLLPGQGVFLLRPGRGHSRRAAQQRQRHQQSGQHTHDLLHLHPSCCMSMFQNASVSVWIIPSFPVLSNAGQDRKPAGFPAGRLFQCFTETLTTAPASGSKLPGDTPVESSIFFSTRSASAPSSSTGE